MKQPFSIIEAFKFGWAKTRAHSMLVFQVVLSFFVLQVVQDIIGRVLRHDATGSLATFGLWVLSIFIGTGATVISLKLARNEHAQFRDLLPDWRLVWKFFVAGICVGVVMAVPLLLASLVILGRLIQVYGLHALGDMARYASYIQDPRELHQFLMPVWQSVGVLGYLVITLAVICSVYLALRYSMVRFAVIDAEGITESLSKSATLTSGVKWQILGFAVLAGVLNILGAIPFYIGLLVTVPMTMIAYAHIYDKLRG